MIRELDYSMFPEISPYGNFVDDLPEMSSKLLTELLLHVLAGLISITALAVTAATNTDELNFGALIVFGLMAMNSTVGVLIDLIAISGTHQDMYFDLAIKGRAMTESDLQRAAKELYDVRVEHYYKRWVFIGVTAYGLLCTVSVIFTSASAP